MRILVLTSRYTAARDIISEDFGRQIRLFAAFQERGHEIDMFVADYRKFEKKRTKLHGMNIIIEPFGLFHFFSFINALKKQLKTKKYDALVATSDPLWGIIGYYLSKRHKIKFLYDLHDNYETYAMYRIPFFSMLDRFVMRRADMITTITEMLKGKISSIRKNKVYVVRNGADRKLFRPLNKKECRKFLKLPPDKKLIVYAGSLHRLEGPDRLIAMFEKYRKELDAELIIAGRFHKGEEKNIKVKNPGIRFLGSLLQKDVVKLINAGDVAVIPYTNNNQVTYGFPYKLSEYLACNVPVVATAVGDIPIILKDHQECLCDPNSLEDMKNKIINQLKSKIKYEYEKELKELSWEHLAKKMENILK